MKKKKFQILAFCFLTVCLLASTAACGGKQTMPTGGGAEAPAEDRLEEETEQKDGILPSGEKEDRNDTDENDEKDRENDEKDGKNGEDDGENGRKRPPKPDKMPSAGRRKRKKPIRPAPMPTPQPKPLL